MLKNYRLTKKNMRRRVKVALLYAPFTFRPEQILIDITDRCNFRCPTCTKWKHSSKEGELTTQQWITFLNQAASIPFSKRVVFAGGEPFLRQDLMELVSHAAGLNLSSVVVSNGSLLDEARLRKLQKTSLNYLMISLNALEAGIHDDTRGVTGSHKHIMHLIEAYTANRGTMDLGIASVIMKCNLDHILPLVEFMTYRQLHGIIFQAYMDNTVHHPFRGKNQIFRAADWYETNPDLVRNHDRLDEVIDQLLLHQRQGAQILNAPSQLRAMKAFYRNPETYQAIPCTAGVTSYMVDAYGDVRLCYGHEPVGNILRQDPLTIWKSSAAQTLRERVSHCHRSCRIMNHVY